VVCSWLEVENIAMRVTPNRLFSSLIKAKMQRPVALSIFVFFVCLYLLTYKGICTGDNLLHYDLVVNTVSTGQPSLPEDRYDLEKQRYLKLFVAEGVDGRLYLTLPPGLAMASIPLGCIGVAVESIVRQPPSDIEGTSRRNIAEVRRRPSAFFVGLINPLVSALLIVVFFGTVRVITHSLERAAVFSVVLGLGTIVWPYSTTYWKQPLASLCLFGALSLLVRGLERRGLRNAALSGLLVGFAFLTRYETALMLLSFCLFIVIAHYSSIRKMFRLLIAHIGSFSISVILLMCWNFYRFGSVFETGAEHQANFSASFKADLLLTLPANLISLNQSIFLFSPPLVLFFLGIVPLLKKSRALAIAVTSISLTGLILYSKFTLWDASASWGPRFLVCLTPFLLIPAATIQLDSRWRRTLVVGLLVAGALVQLVPALVPYQHAAVSEYFKDADVPQSYYTKSEIVPHFHQLLAGKVELWWMGDPVLGMLGLWLFVIMGLSGIRLLRIVLPARKAVSQA
jgi:hypothetical protein